MKRIVLIIIMLFGVTLGVNAQSVNQVLLSNAASGVKPLDTITNTGTVTMSSPLVTGTPSLTTVVAIFTKLTGTVAGVATLQGSLNAVDWVTADATTYTVTDVASQATSWKLTGSPYLYYRVQTVGSGTSTYTVKGSAFTRKL